MFSFARTMELVQATTIYDIELQLGTLYQQPFETLHHKNIMSMSMSKVNLYSAFS